MTAVSWETVRGLGGAAGARAGGEWAPAPLLAVPLVPAAPVAAAFDAAPLEPCAGAGRRDGPAGRDTLSLKSKKFVFPMGRSSISGVGPATRQQPRPRGNY